MALRRESPFTLSFILITVLLDMVGLGIILPVLPSLLESLTGAEVAGAAKIGGYLVFIYALMQFLFSPVLGNLSDRFGRRPVLLLSLIGLTTDYAIMSIAPSIAYLFIGRMIAGISGAAVSTATAYMADITPREKRAQRFGLIGAAFGLGFIIGPIVGGVLGEISVRAPFMVAAGLAFANFLFGLIILPESLPKTRRRRFDIKRANPFGALLAFKSYPAVLWLIAALFLFVLAGQSYPSVWNFFTIEKFGWTSSQIGISLAAFGILFALTQGFLVGPVVKRFGEAMAILAGMIAACIAFLGVSLIHTPIGLYGYLIVGAFSGLAAPAISGLMSRLVPDNSQGELQGAVNAGNSLSAILGPIIATQLFAFFTTSDGAPIYFPGAPFMAAAFMVLASGILFYVTFFRFDLMHAKPVAHDPHAPDIAKPGEIAIPPHNGSERPEDPADEEDEALELKKSAPKPPL
ncbi:MAG: TCR/Tet family MFS transporter [Alphaproteobacteria bacterium]|nr:TCR/Tet family MFS transporter [Alphaproteobacteria bacterium]